MSPHLPAGPGARITVLDPLPLEVARPMVLLRLGYRGPAQVPARTARLIDEVMRKGRGLLAPKAVYREVSVSAPEPGVTLIAGGIRTTSRSVRDRLGACRGAVVFAGTVGPGVDEWYRELTDSDQITRALLASAYGSAAAIALGSGLESIIGRRLEARGLRPTRRYAPGYGDWELSDQRPLLALLDAGSIGIRLTEDCLMLPTKSISGIIGGSPPAAAGERGGRREAEG
ncbi:MAG: vitamin B12 dependent-methionine synthase activation domain-containing protein [Acidobacteriota bacterium]